MKQTHMLSKISLLAFAVLAFLSGCSSEPTSIEVSVMGLSAFHRITELSASHRITQGLKVSCIQHYEVLDSNVTFTQTINGHHFEVRDGSDIQWKRDCET